VIDPTGVLVALLVSGAGGVASSFVVTLGVLSQLVLFSRTFDIGLQRFKFYLQFSERDQSFA